MKLGFVGLGNMGRAMARILLEAGHTLAVWDRTPTKAEVLVKGGARLATSPADAARGAEVLLSSLPDDHVVYTVALGSEGTAARSGPEPIVRGLAPGATHVSLSTISPSMSRMLDAAHRGAGQRYAAATVFGRPDAAERGELVVLAAGQDDVIDHCGPIFDVLGKKTYRLGHQVERANAMKLVVNLMLGSLLEVFGEAYALAESHGLSATQALEVLKDSTLSNEVITGYGERIAKRQFDPAGFRLTLGLKDVDLALQSAEEAALQLPFASALRDRFLVAIARGLDEKDWAAVASTLPYKHAA